MNRLSKGLMFTPRLDFLFTKLPWLRGSSRAPGKHSQAWAPLQTSRKADQPTGTGSRNTQFRSWPGPLLCPPLPIHPQIFFSGGGEKTLQRPCNANYSFSLNIKRPGSPGTYRNRLNPVVKRIGSQDTLNVAWLPLWNRTGTSGKSLDLSGPQLPLPGRGGRSGSLCLMDRNFSLEAKFLPSPWSPPKGWVGYYFWSFRNSSGLK